MTDSVGIFHPKDSKPTSTVTREEARAMKARGEAYFINHGRDLRLVSLKPERVKRDQRDLEGTIDNWETRGRSLIGYRGTGRNRTKVWLHVTTKQYYTRQEV